VRARTVSFDEISLSSSGRSRLALRATRWRTSRKLYRFPKACFDFRFRPLFFLRLSRTGRIGRACLLVWVARDEPRPFLVSEVALGHSARVIQPG